MMLACGKALHFSHPGQNHVIPRPALAGSETTGKLSIRRGIRSKPLEPLSQRLLEPLQHGGLSQKFLAARWQHFPWDCLILSRHSKHS